MSTFVALGNVKKPFARVLREVENLANEGILPLPVVIQAGHTAFRPAGCDVIDFISMDEFNDHMRKASLVIIQAGAGSMISSLQQGKIPIVVPRLRSLGEHIDDHQSALARAFSQTDRVVSVYDMKDLREAVCKVLSLPPRREERTGSLEAIRRCIGNDLRAYASLYDS